MRWTTCANASHELRVQEERTHDWRKNTIRKRVARSCQDFPSIPNVKVAHLVGRNVVTIMQGPTFGLLTSHRAKHCVQIRRRSVHTDGHWTTLRHHSCDKQAPTVPSGTAHVQDVTEAIIKTGPDNDCPKFLRESKSVKLPRTPSV